MMSPAAKQLTTKLQTKEGEAPTPQDGEEEADDDNVSKKEKEDAA